MSKISLDPERGGGRCLPAAGLTKADLIVSTTGATVSGVIRLGSGSPVSHAMLYVGDGFVVEAVSSGVRRAPLTDAFHDASLAVAYRMTGLSEQEANLIVDFALQQRNKGYDTAGALGAGVARNPAVCTISGVIICAVAKSGLASSDNKFFCSELVLAAFAAANRPISAQRPSTSVPGDIPRAYSVGRLEYVGHLIINDS